MMKAPRRHRRKKTRSVIYLAPSALQVCVMSPHPCASSPFALPCCSHPVVLWPCALPELVRRASSAFSAIRESWRRRASKGGELTGLPAATLKDLQCQVGRVCVLPLAVSWC